MQVCLFLAHIHVKLDQITASNQPSALECVLHCMRSPLISTFTPAPEMKRHMQNTVR